jgi:hypothetical protein
MYDSLTVKKEKNIIKSTLLPLLLAVVRAEDQQTVDLEDEPVDQSTVQRLGRSVTCVPGLVARQPPVDRFPPRHDAAGRQRFEGVHRVHAEQVGDWK